MPSLIVEEVEIKLSNLDKILWPELGYSKGDLIHYYIEVYPYMKEFLKDRPISLLIYPDGIYGKSFFQKNAPKDAPHWLTTVPIYSQHRKEAINWIVANKLADLIWVANRASIGIHTWFSTFKKLDKPDFAVFDLDPGNNSNFKDVILTAFIIKEILDEFKLKSYVKTSGKRGIHIYLPLKPIYSFLEVKNFLHTVGEMVVKTSPQLATMVWPKKDRKGKVYIDYRQNGRAKTLPVPYSLRPTPEASISTPLNWKELSLSLKPTDFHLGNWKERLGRVGNPWANFFQDRQSLPDFFL